MERGDREREKGDGETEKKEGWGGNREKKAGKCCLLFFLGGGVFSLLIYTAGFNVLMNTEIAFVFFASVSLFIRVI